ncbi:MAG: hypothetical protein PHO10_00025 [Gemmiger sp.]|nr:hypothetical protein [Gemmiger sp.]
MRTRRTIINTAYTLGSSLVLLVLGLITRKLFVGAFELSIPGYAATIEKMFSFFSVAEFGVGGVISYRLYAQIAAKNIEQISKYMSLYKWIYRLIGIAICLIAGVAAFFLPWMNPGVADMTPVYTIYGLQILSTISSYFLVTRRLMYTCTQQGYLCTRMDLCFNVATYLARIAISLWWPNYILYFGVTILFNTLANVAVAVRYKKDFPEVADVKVTFADFRALGLFHDLRYYLVHRLSNAVYGSSDYIVGSRMRGAGSVTYMSNYATVSDSITNIGNKLLDSFAAAIGNIVYDKDAEADGHARQVFWSMDLFSYGFGSAVAVAYFCLFQPFMLLWMGPKMLLPLSYVFFFCLNEYVGWNHRMLGSYRAVLGHFEEDQWFMVASAISNIVLSFLLIYRFGLPGIVAATVFAHCLMWVGRARVVCRHYIKGGGGHYLAIQLLHLVTLFGEMALCSWLCGFMGGGLLGFAGRLVVAGVLPSAINLAVYGWMPDAAYLRGYAKRLAAKITKKG